MNSSQETSQVRNREYHDVCFEPNGPEFKGLWKKIVSASKKMGFKTPSEFVRFACMEAVDESSKKKKKRAESIASKAIEKGMDNVKAWIGANNNYRVEVENMSDKQRVFVRVSFHTRSKKTGKVEKFTKRLSFLRDGTKVRVRAES